MRPLVAVVIIAPAKEEVRLISIKSKKSAKRAEVTPLLVHPMGPYVRKKGCEVVNGERQIISRSCLNWACTYDVCQLKKIIFQVKEVAVCSELSSRFV